MHYLCGTILTIHSFYTRPNKGYTEVVTASKTTKKT